MNGDERTKFGAYLKSLREAKGLTQKQAGELAKVSNPYLAQVERGQRNPPNADILSRLARVYGVSENSILKEAGYMSGGTVSLPASVIERAFEFVRTDEAFSFGTRLKGEELSLETKAFLVEVYQKATDRILLTQDEVEAVRSQE